MADAHYDPRDSKLAQQWSTVLGMMEVQIDNPADFKAYLAESTATSFDNGVLRITVRNGFLAAWIRQRVMGSLRRFTAQVFGEGVKIEIDTALYTDPEVLAREGLAGDYSEWASSHLNRHRATLARENARYFPANPDLTFKRYLCSESNKRAYNAAQAVVKEPGVKFNPLTIASETGQGKTHLLNAIANEMRSTNLNVICLTGEEFVDSYVKSSQQGKVAAVRDRMRAVDALLIDGIESLIGKAKTQSFLLSLLEHLIAERKQLVLTFNTAYPMNELVPEITSRLEGGLTLRLESPDVELKRGILQRYVLERDLKLERDALDFLSERVVRNVREVIGGITRSEADVRFSKSFNAAQTATISLAVAVEAVRDRLGTPDPSLLPPESVVDAVAHEFGLEPANMYRAGRGNRVMAMARDVAIYMLRDKCGLTSSETGALLGGRPHSTILAALKRYSERRNSDPKLIDAEHRIERELQNSDW